MHLKIIFKPSPEVGYTVYVPRLPGCISEGDTLDEARRNIREADESYLDPEDSALPGCCVVEELAL